MSDATLLELVSRGKQDAYFIQGAQRTWFGADYERRSPQTREVRVELPSNPILFGNWVDIDLPHAGDILMSAYIRIQMPTWLPTEIAAINRTRLVELENVPAVGPPTYARYGWTNGTANYLIKRWAFYADNVLLDEGWGDFNSWYPDMETSQMHAPLYHSSTATHDGTSRAIQRNAILPEIAFRLPLIGGQWGGEVGLPLCARTNQRLYVRVWLADKTEMVESSPLGSAPGGASILDVSGEYLYDTCPAPWKGQRIFVDGVDSGQTTLPEWKVGQPTIYARYTVLYLDNEARDALRATPHTILYRQQQREDFIIPNGSWIPGARWVQRLSIFGFYQALFLGLLSDARRKQNKYRDINPPGDGEWLVNLGLTVNGQDRIDFWPPKKFQELANNTQLARDVESQLYYLIFGVSPEGEVAGALNIKRTQKVLLTLMLADVPADPATNSNLAYATLMGLSWNVFEVRDGRGAVRFVD